MKSAIAVKVVVGIGTVGAIATGVTFALLPDSFGSYLNKQGRALLNSDSSHWATLVEKYKAEGDDLLITIDNKKIEKNQLDKAKLEKWCNKNSIKKFTNTDDPIYFRISAWCTEPKTIKELIGKDKVILDITEPDSSSSKTNKNEAIWAERVAQYKQAGNSHLIKEIKGNTESTEIPLDNGVDAKKLRAWCKFSQDKHFKHEKDKRFLSYLKWCIN